jgi:CRISPR-associated protein Cmr2
MNNFQKRMTVAIAWCLAWGDGKQPNHSVEALHELRQAILTNRPLDDSSLQEILQQTQALVGFSNDSFEFPSDREALASLLKQHSGLSEAKIGLVYGGATKIKGYVFESADLQEIRGASALLDRINLIDLPAFFQGETDRERFQQCHNAAAYCRQVRSDWLYSNFPSLEDALTPEMVIYSTGGNILAFCPSGLVDDLADAIEKRYTTETLTANACAVGDTFRPLEIYLGLLATPMDNTPWLETIQANSDNPALRAYFGLATKQQEDGTETEVLTPVEAFRQTKGFSELVGKLANQFNQRRSGYDVPGSSRPSRRYPPMFETHPYLMRDDSDRRSLVLELTPTRVLEMNPEQVDEKLKVDEILPDNPKFSESSARKRWIGQVTKRENSRWRAWYRKTELLEKWNPIQVLDDEAKAQGIEFKTEEEKRRREDLFRVGLSSWVNRFEQYLHKNNHIDTYDQDRQIFKPEQRQEQRAQVRDYYRREARSLTEIGAASNGFVGYIYADGNNMGQHIRENIRTPEDYQQFSQDIFKATEQSVYWAIAKHLEPFYYTPGAKSSRDNKDPVWIHPFEIITIGGDDVLVIVPANKALEIAHSIGEKFEEILDGTGRYTLHPEETQGSSSCHRYKKETAKPSQSRLSISSGVLISAENTPIYYAFNLVAQLLKSAKKKAKDLRDKGHFGGTVDFLTLKAVTMISSDIESFRQEGLTVRFPERKQDLKLYAAPFTLHELEGLIKTIQAVKSSGFPKSQLYQVRSLLERGKRTAILNYRYFKVRLQKEHDRRLLTQEFENAWCQPLDEYNPGNLAPWMTAQRKDDSYNSDDTDTTDHKTIYETIWRELVELYPFVDPEKEDPKPETSDEQADSLGARS